MATVDEAAAAGSTKGRLSGKVALVTGAGQGLRQAFSPSGSPATAPRWWSSPTATRRRGRSSWSKRPALEGAFLLSAESVADAIRSRLGTPVA